MSVSNGGLSRGPAATSNERPDAGDGEATDHASRWARTAHDAARKVVPLRALVAARPASATAPASVPSPAPAPVPPAPAPARAAPRRPTGPELLAEDEVLKRLLQRHPPDPQPLVAKPTRDPIGFALGMIARLIVAGCAAAVAALLLVGTIPLPSRLGSSVANETVARVTPPAPPTRSLAPRAAAPHEATPVATVSVRAAAAAPSAAVAPPAAAPAAAPAERSAFDAGELDKLVKRGDNYLAQGDVAAARLLLRRAAVSRDPRAALSLGATYDPVVLRQLHVVGIRPDVAQARAWYEKAAGYGSRDAAARLSALPGADP